MFGFSNYSAKLKYYGDSNAIVDDKMKDEMDDVAIVQLVGLKPNMYSLLLKNIKKQNA